jgi:hypothetical protein
MVVLLGFVGFVEVEFSLFRGKRRVLASLTAHRNPWKIEHSHSPLIPTRIIFLLLMPASSSRAEKNQVKSFDIKTHVAEAEIFPFSRHLFIMLLPVNETVIDERLLEIPRERHVLLLPHSRVNYNSKSLFVRSRSSWLGEKMSRSPCLG